jgi:hypothetical protein
MQPEAVAAAAALPNRWRTVPSSQPRSLGQTSCILNKDGVRGVIWVNTLPHQIQKKVEPPPKQCDGGTTSSPTSPFASLPPLTEGASSPNNGGGCASQQQEYSEDEASHASFPSDEDYSDKVEKSSPRQDENGSSVRFEELAVAVLSWVAVVATACLTDLAEALLFVSYLVRFSFGRVWQSQFFFNSTFTCWNTQGGARNSSACVFRPINMLLQVDFQLGVSALPSQRFVPTLRILFLNLGLLRSLLTSAQSQIGKFKIHTQLSDNSLSSHLLPLLDSAWSPTKLK